MIQPLSRLLILFSSLLVLSACTTFNHNPPDKQALCNKLKSDIVFNGATSITRQSDIQRSEKQLQQRMYDANDCSSATLIKPPPLP